VILADIVPWLRGRASLTASFPFHQQLRMTRSFPSLSSSVSCSPTTHTRTKAYWAGVAGIWAVFALRAANLQ
jgi:hypothetical protein